RRTVAHSAREGLRHQPHPPRDHLSRKPRARLPASARRTEPLSLVAALQQAGDAGVLGDVADVGGVSDRRAAHHVRARDDNRFAALAWPLGNQRNQARAYVLRCAASHWGASMPFTKSQNIMARPEIIMG